MKNHLSEPPALAAARAREQIQHLPVSDGAHLISAIAPCDLSAPQSTSAINLLSDIYQQTSVADLARIKARVKLLQQSLAAADLSANCTGRVATAVADALTIRLIELAEARLGPAPIDYVWVAAGSQARNEQSANSDQDNCMLLDDHFSQALHAAYFRELTRMVCDGLAACGYSHCPGQVMAMTDKWRQPLQRWTQYFDQWISQPEPMALMLSCVFFDMRAVYGKTQLLEPLQRDVRKRAQGNSLFLAYMVKNALKHGPPLGWFGTIKLIRGGENLGTFDIKHTGLIPIVDLARIYALAGGVNAVNTHERLELAAPTNEVSAQAARDLRIAFEFLGKLRIAHQARQSARGLLPDNFVALAELSGSECNQLKTAFALVRTLQRALSQRYQSQWFQ